MRRRALVLSALLIVVSTGGCTVDEQTPAGPDFVVQPTPASLEEPLGESALGVEADRLRDALVARVRGAGGARLTVTGGPTVTMVDLDYDDGRQSFARRFTWNQDHQSMEVMDLHHRICANQNAGGLLASLTPAAPTAWLDTGDRRYTCTARGFRDMGLPLLDLVGPTDPVARLAGLNGAIELDDLGVEDDPGGGQVRHLRLRTVEKYGDRPAVRTVFDVWMDGRLRMQRMEFASLSGTGSAYVATFDYAPLAEVLFPPADQRRDLVRRVGNGIPGFGGYMVQQFCPDYPEVACSPETAGQ